MLKIIGTDAPYDQCRYVYKNGDLNESLIDVVKKLKKHYKIALLTNNNN